jgi:hypothetical protein
MTSLERRKWSTFHHKTIVVEQLSYRPCLSRLHAWSKSCQYDVGPQYGVTPRHRPATRTRATACTRFRQCRECFDRRCMRYRSDLPMIRWRALWHYPKRLRCLRRLRSVSRLCSRHRYGLRLPQASRIGHRVLVETQPSVDKHTRSIQDALKSGQTRAVLAVCKSMPLSSKIFASQSCALRLILFSFEIRNEACLRKVKCQCITRAATEAYRSLFPRLV